MKTDLQRRPHSVKLTESITIAGLACYLLRRGEVVHGQHLQLSWILRVQSGSAQHNACSTEFSAQSKPIGPCMHALCSNVHMSMAFPAIATNNITCQALIFQDAPFASCCHFTKLCWLMLLVLRQQQPQMQDQMQKAESY